MPPHSNSSSYVKNCGLKVIRRLCPFPPVPICAHHASSDKRESVVLMKSELKSSGSVYTKLWDVGWQDTGPAALCSFRLIIARRLAAF
jgi:hypothetical protein